MALEKGWGGGLGGAADSSTPCVGQRSSAHHCPPRHPCTTAWRQAFLPFTHRASCRQCGPIRPHPLSPNCCFAVPLSVTPRTATMHPPLFCAAPAGAAAAALRPRTCTYFT